MIAIETSLSEKSEILPAFLNKLEEEISQSVSTAIVTYTPTESGQFAQIPLTSSPIPVVRQESVEDMTDERLDRYICGHVVGFKKNLLAAAEGLAEKKSRLVRKGCQGKWSAFVKYEVGMSVSCADRLVRNWQVYLQLGPRVRRAAELAGINFSKPAVKALLQSFNDEALLSGEPSQKRFESWVLVLQEAGKRKQNAERPTDETESESDAGDSDADSVDDSEPEQDSDEETDNSSGPKEKTVALHLSAQQAEEFDELIAELKTWMGTQDRPNIVLHAVRCLAEKFKSECQAVKA